MARLRSDPERWLQYQQRQKEGQKQKYEDPEFWQRYYEGIKRRDSDPEYHERRLAASRAKICRRVKTPLGVFDSITAAAQAHGMTNTETMRNRLKSKNFPDYCVLEDDPESGGDE